jgi:arylsulfatase A-like enzyme
MANKLKELDDILGYLIQELRSHHLYDKLNLIVTSDHGMEQVSNNTAIFLDKHVDVSLFKAYGSGALYNIFVNDRTYYELHSKISIFLYFLFFLS